VDAETPGPVPPGHVGLAQARHPVRGADPKQMISGRIASSLEHLTF